MENVHYLGTHIVLGPPDRLGTGLDSGVGLSGGLSVPEPDCGIMAACR